MDCFPTLFAFSLKREGTLKGVFIKWSIPFGLMMFSTFISMWLLHIATYYYVHSMLQFEGNYRLRTTSNFSDPVRLSPGIRSTDVSFGSLEDPLEHQLGYKKINIHALDAIAALFPLAFMVLSVLTDALGIFTKTMIAHCFLALGKGFFSICTVVPDSAGWQTCKERIGDAGIHWLSQERTYAEILGMEAFGVEGRHLRWCADMMWSGHTYVTTLYGLAVYELVKNATKNKPSIVRYPLIAFVFAITVGEQMLEVYCVLLNRFHYTMDVAMAILLVFLFYTNGSISVVAKWWVLYPRKRDRELSQESRMQIQNALEETDPELANAVVVLRAEDLQSDGDVFVPPCCVPFCCFAGGQHIFSDVELRSFMEHSHVTPSRLEALDGMFIRTQTMADELARTQQLQHIGGEYDACARIGILDDAADQRQEQQVRVEYGQLPTLLPNWLQTNKQNAMKRESDK